jgi:hypothetical protein
MTQFRLTTPVAFFVFNRPETTRRVFERIAQARPSRLLLVADGARENRPEEAERCRQVREIISKIDWPCEVTRNFADKNLGCRARMSSGIDWVFHEVAEAIILEDDCLPDPSFFQFTQELLERYRDEERVMMIGGTNFQQDRNVTANSYYFSRYTHIWGWATWRRAWQGHYDVQMKKWPEFRQNSGLEKIFRDKKTVLYWTKIFDLMHAGKIDTWDYQLLFANFFHGTLAATPRVNLISNIGFGPGATHTLEANNFQANMTAQAMPFPLRHPKEIVVNEAADEFVQNTCFRQSVQERIRAKWKSLWRMLHSP